MGWMLESSRARCVPCLQSRQRQRACGRKAGEKEGARSRTVDSSLNIKVGVLISYLFLDARLFALILHMR